MNRLRFIGYPGVAGTRLSMERGEVKEHVRAASPILRFNTWRAPTQCATFHKASRRFLLRRNACGLHD